MIFEQIITILVLISLQDSSFAKMSWCFNSSMGPNFSGVYIMLVIGHPPPPPPPLRFFIYSAPPPHPPLNFLTNLETTSAREKEREKPEREREGERERVQRERERQERERDQTERERAQREGKRESGRERDSCIKWGEGFARFRDWYPGVAHETFPHSVL